MRHRRRCCTSTCTISTRTACPGWRCWPRATFRSTRGPTRAMPRSTCSCAARLSPTPASPCCERPSRPSASKSAKSCAGRTRNQKTGGGGRVGGFVPCSSSASMPIMADKRRSPETLFDDIGIRMPYEVERVIYEQQTEHQHLVLFEHPFFGKMLMLDGATQVTSADEFVYHEMMAHVPILAYGRAKEVLIVGGGDCGVAEEVLKYKALNRHTQVEIDASVIEFSKEHFPEFTKPVFADDRFDLVIADGMKYVARTDRRFDVIIVDSTDPQGPGKVLFSQKFYAACS